MQIEFGPDFGLILVSQPGRYFFKVKSQENICIFLKKRQDRNNLWPVVSITNYNSRPNTLKTCTLIFKPGASSN